MAEKSLSDLLAEVDALFPGAPPGDLQTFNYTLGRFPAGWAFRVVDNWYRWNAAGLRHDFRLYQTPEDALRAFLLYVSEKGIDVASLMGDEPNANT